MRSALRLVGRATGGTPVNEFRLIRFGPVEVDRAAVGGAFSFTREMADQALAAFEKLGRRLVIDYEHQSLGKDFNRRIDQLAPAAGWTGKLEVRNDGLWAAGVEWTPRARQLIAAGEYAYFSPVIYWMDETCTQLQSLGPVALTNDPAMRGVQRLAAKQQRGEVMVTTMLAARPLVGRLDPNGLNDDAQAPSDELLNAIAAIGQTFNERDFQELVRERATDFVQTVRDNVDDEDLMVLDVLHNVGYALKQGDTVEVIAGNLMAGEMRSLGYSRSCEPSRAALIAAARRTYAGEATDPTKITICSERRWVNVALRDAHQQRLTDREIVEHGIAEGDAANSTQRGRRALSAARSAGRVGNEDRAIIIARAKRSYVEEATNPAKLTICSEKAWVHTALRDAGQAALTGAEIIQYDISTGSAPNSTPDGRRALFAGRGAN
jgi:hypothetical protein